MGRRKETDNQEQTSEVMKISFEQFIYLFFQEEKNIDICLHDGTILKNVKLQDKENFMKQMNMNVVNGHKVDFIIKDDIKFEP